MAEFAGIAGRGIAGNSGRYRPMPFNRCSYVLFSPRSLRREEFEVKVKAEVEVEVEVKRLGLFND